MKLILTRPKYHTHLITPPLGLGYLSSFIKEKGFKEVKIVDGLNMEISNAEIVKICEDEHADIVGISTLSDYFNETVELSRLLKRKGFKIVIGGPHATSIPIHTLEKTEADYIILGEGEITLFELLKYLENGEQPEGISGLITKDSTQASEREFINDLDTIPYPDWEQIDPRTYKKAPHGGLVKSFPVAPIISSRGCPFSCTFCASPSLWKRKIRFRKPESVVGEIEYLVNFFKVKEIHFEDDNLTLKKNHVEKICQLLIEKKIKINWATPNGIRVETVTPELLKLMKKSGCYYLAFGIESGNQAILDNIKKKTSLETIEYAVREAKKLGLLTQGFFIFGLPGETKETIEETIKFAKKIPLDRAQFLMLDVLPGSEIWEGLGEKKNLCWNYRSYQEVSWVPDSINIKDLKKAPAKAFRSFFLRPKQIFSLLKYFKPAQIKFISRRIRDFKIFKTKG